MASSYALDALSAAVSGFAAGATMNVAMTISDESLEGFISLCEEIDGQRRTREEARPIAIRLLDLYRLITQPVPGEPSEQAQSEREAARSKQEDQPGRISNHVLK